MQRVKMVSPVNTIIIAINIVVFLVMSLIGDTNNMQFMFEHGANFWPSVFIYHEYSRLITCAFIHFGLRHLVNNMLVLGFVGDNLERAVGKIKYLIIYFASALGASLASAAWLMFTNRLTISGGASGAIFGVVGAMLVIVIKHRGRLEDLSSRQIGLFVVFTIYHGVTSAGTDNMAHIAGFIVGAFLGFILYRPKRYSYY